MELFVTHNISLQATYLRRPQHALDAIEPVRPVPPTRS
jgi:hypothetical protein